MSSFSGNKRRDGKRRPVGFSQALSAAVFVAVFANAACGGGTSGGTSGSRGGSGPEAGTGDADSTGGSGGADSTGGSGGADSGGGNAGAEAGTGAGTPGGGAGGDVVGGMPGEGGSGGDIEPPPPEGPDIVGQNEGVQPPQAYVQKVKTLVNGGLATKAEIDLVTDNPEALRNLVDAWMDTPGFETQMMPFLTEYLQQGGIIDDQLRAQFRRYPQRALGLKTSSA